MYRTDARTRRLPRNAGRWYTLTAVARRLARGRNADPPEWDDDDEETEHHARRGPILTVPLERWYDGKEAEADREPSTLPPASVRYGSVKAAVLAWLNEHNEGTSTAIAVGVLRDFPTGGNVQNIRVHLVQMANRGDIQRLGRGVYARW